MHRIRRLPREPPGARRPRRALPARDRTAAPRRHPEPMASLGHPATLAGPPMLQYGRCPSPRPTGALRRTKGDEVDFAWRMAAPAHVGVLGSVGAAGAVAARRRASQTACSWRTWPWCAIETAFVTRPGAPSRRKECNCPPGRSEGCGPGCSPGPHLPSATDLPGKSRTHPGYSELPSGR